MSGWIGAVGATGAPVRWVMHMTEDSKIELNRRRVLGGIVTVGAAAAAAGAGTFAYFNDTESSNNNEITAGTLNLTNAANGQISITNAVPGDTIGPTTISAEYDSASSVNPVEVDFACTLSEPGSEPTEPGNSTDQTASALAQQLTVNAADLVVDGSSANDLTSTQSVTTVDDLNNLSIDAAFGGVAPGSTIGLRLDVTFDQSAGNAYQADGVTIDTTFTAQQPSED